MAITFDTTGEQLISSSCDRTVKVWDIETKRCLNPCHGHAGAVYLLAHSFGRLFSGGFDETVRLWPFKVGECLQILRTPYHDGMAIAGARFLNDTQTQTLKALGYK